VNYKDAINKVLEHEGGFVNNPLDKGGATNWGVTQETYNNYMTYITGKPYVSTVAEIQAMPLDTAIKIYKLFYWDVIWGDKIKKYSVAAAIFDQAINRGPDAALKQAQRVLGITQDGLMGNNTLTALNNATATTDSEAKFLSSYLQESILAYNTIVKNNPSQSVFLNGWLKRVESLRSYVNSYIGSINATTVGIGLGVVILLAGSFLLYSKRDVIAGYFNKTSAPAQVTKAA